MKNYLLCIVVLLFQACASTHPLQATSVPLSTNLKIGKSCGHYIGLTVSDTASFLVSGFEDIYAAANNAGITTISIVDREATNYFFYKKQCTVVRGL